MSTAHAKPDSSPVELHTIADDKTELLKRREEDTEIIGAILGEFGLGTSERAVYGCLFRLGTRQASTVAKQTGMSRAHVYEVLDRLIARGLVCVHERNGTRHFTCLSVEELMLVLQQKELRLADQRKQLNDVMLSLQQPASDTLSDPQTSSYRGPEARARLFQELTRVLSREATLFCCADGSLLFDGSVPTRASIEQLLRITSDEIHIVFYSEGANADLLVKELDNQRCSSFQGSFPIEMVINGDRVTILGKKGLSQSCLSIEQPALADSLRALARVVQPLRSFERASIAA